MKARSWRRRSGITKKVLMKANSWGVIRGDESWRWKAEDET
jgi:hypothetical protein